MGETESDTLLNTLSLMGLFLPLAGFIVLALLGDDIRREEEEAKAGKEGDLEAWFQGFLPPVAALLRWVRARGTLLANALACAVVVASFALAVRTAFRYHELSQQPNEFRAAYGLPEAESYMPYQPYLGIEWISAGPLQVPFALLLDPLSLVMLLVVTGVGSLIHIYSLGYMAHDEDRVRYFSYLNLFTFFMLLLVLGSSLPLMFVGWEGVGLCSYLLIGFWFRKKSASDAGLKAFVVNRIGDAGLLLGMLVAFYAFGTVDLFQIVQVAHESAPKEAFGEWGTLTAIALLLFVGACGKSAQVPLHVWLPDAMEGPTPVSALIHAATMVTAGVYMVARLSPLYAKSETALAVVAIVGTVTALMAATVALVQTDIKRVLAYSTVSQLGYMFAACGVGAFGVAIFHLFTHAFFKALLFLGSGSVIHALSGEQDMRRMGGLWKKIPWTFGTFLVGTAAIAGIPFLAGFYSKDAILAAAIEGHRPVIFGIALFTALLTAFYMSRLLFLTFFGEFRGGHEAEHHLHESPWTMLGPLCLLAVGSIGGGYVPIPDILAPALRLAPAHGEHPLWVPAVATLSAVIGIVTAYYLYVLYTDVPARVGSRFRAVRRVLEEKYGFDLAFNWLAGRVVVDGSSGVLWKGVDAGAIDGAVNGTAAIVDGVARTARFVQTGLVRGYALLIFGGAVALLAYLLWFRA